MTLSRTGPFSWVPQTCSNPTLSYSGGSEGSADDVSFQLDRNLGLIDRVQYKETLSVSTSTSFCTFDLKLEFTIQTQYATLHGFISFNAQNISWGALPFAAWTGELKSTPSSNYFVLDYDLFNGKKAIVFSQQQTPSPNIDWSGIYKMAGHLNAHMDSTAATVSGFPGSIRGIFLTPSSDPKLLHNTKGLFSRRAGEFRHLQQKCQNETKCSSKIVDLVLGLLRLSHLSQYCYSFRPDLSSFYSELNVQLFGTSSAVKVLTVNGMTRLSVQCGGPSQGKLEIRVSVTSKDPWLDFPLASFNEERIILDMIRSNSFLSKGMIAGTLYVQDGTIRTINTNNLFEGGRGGYPITDYRLTDQSALKNVLLTVPALLATTVNHIDKAVAAIFHQKDWVNLYSRVTPYPTHFGFFQWFVERAPELTLFVSFSQKLSLNLVMYQELPFSLEDPAFQNISTSFEKLFKTYDFGTIPNLTDPESVQFTHSSTQFMIHSSFQIEDLSKVTLYAPPRFAAVCKLRGDVKANAIKKFSVVYDYTSSTTELSVATSGHLSRVVHMNGAGNFFNDTSEYSAYEEAFTRNC